MSARAVVFDMDGLLIDSERAVLVCWREAAASLALSLPESLWTSMVGLHEAGCAVLLEGLLGEERAGRLALECQRRYDRLVEAGLPLRPGARELLQDVVEAGVPVAIATSTRRERAVLKLARSGIAGFFEVIVTSSDVAEAKPAPDVYRLAAARLGLPATACIALEDSEFGVRAAAAAGMQVIQVPDLLEPTEVTRSLAQIADSLAAARPLLETFLQKRLPPVARCVPCEPA